MLPPKNLQVCSYLQRNSVLVKMMSVDFAKTTSKLLQLFFVSLQQNKLQECSTPVYKKVLERKCKSFPCNFIGWSLQRFRNVVPANKNTDISSNMGIIQRTHKKKNMGNLQISMLAVWLHSKPTYNRQVSKHTSLTKLFLGLHEDHVSISQKFSEGRHTLILSTLALDINQT